MTNKNPKNYGQPQQTPYNAGQTMNEEFGAETDVQEVRKQNQKAEQKKHTASGQYAKNSYGGNQTTK